MKFTIDKTDFTKALKRICGVCTNKSSFQILSSCRIEATDRTVTIMATDLDITLRIVVDADVTDEGTAIVSAKQLLDTVQNQSAFDVNVETVGEKLFVMAGNFRASIQKGLESEYPDLEFPDTDSAITVDAIAFKGIIDKTIFSISKDDSRPDFAGAFLNVDSALKKIQMVSTDGHRLSIASTKANVEGEVKESFARGMIVPRKGLIELSKSIVEGDVSLDVQQSKLIVVSGAYTFAIKLIAGQFPNFSSVVPERFDHRCIVRRDDFQRIIKRASIFAPKSGTMKLTLEKNALEVFTEDTQSGQMNDRIDSDYSGKGVAIGFNWEYIDDVLSVIDGENVCLKAIDEDSPAVFCDADSDSCTFIIMPMQL